MPGPAAAPSDPVLTVVTRSGRVESWHRGAVAVVRGGDVVFAVGDVDSPVFARSAVKPMQALPLLEEGVAERLGVTAEELALTSASHGGTPRHVELAARLLARGGLSGDNLGCGPHPPTDREAGLALARSGGKPQRIHNNCSGKHAGFLLLAQHLGVDPAAYLEPDSPSQQRIRASVVEMTGVAEAALHVGLDGCGAPTFALPLTALARGFANLTNPQALPPVRARACQMLLQAITAHPEVLAGEGRLCTALIRALPGGIYPKNGAEGVYAFGLPGRGTGVAIKVDDGAERGYFPVVVDVLARLGLFAGDVPETLAGFRRVPVLNTQRRHCGEVTRALSLDALAPPVAGGR